MNLSCLFVDVMIVTHFEFLTLHKTFPNDADSVNLSSSIAERDMHANELVCDWT